MAGARVLAVASGKGGVGKTTTAVALGACAGAADREVVVVDADLGMANLATFLGLDADGPTLHDVLADRATVEEAVVDTGAGFDALASGDALEEYAEADPAGLTPVVEALRERYDVVLLDVGAGLSHDTVLPLGLADDVLVVTTPTPAAVANAAKTVEVCERVNAAVAGVLVSRGVGGDAEAVADDLGVPLLGSIPEDESVAAATAAAEPVPLYDPDGPAGRAFCDLAADLFDVPVTSIDLGRAPTDDGVASLVEGADDGVEADEDEGGGSLFSRLLGGKR
jgi:septum site-determining protein MinD